MIKTIIFDLGGVILNIDYSLTIKAFKNLGASDFDALYTQKKQIQLFDLYDTGKITSAEFRYSLKKELNLSHISDKEFDNAWNAMLLDLPKERLEFIKNLKNYFNIFLFSNANDIHGIELKNICRRDIGQDSISKYFHKEYYSHICGFRKPNPESFAIILKENDLKAEEVLFIDDSMQHVKGAKTIGINALYLPPGNNIINFLPLNIPKIRDILRG